MIENLSCIVRPDREHGYSSTDHIRFYHGDCGQKEADVMFAFNSIKSTNVKVPFKDFAERVLSSNFPYVRDAPPGSDLAKKVSFRIDKHLVDISFVNYIEEDNFPASLYVELEKEEESDGTPGAIPVYECWYSAFPQSMLMKLSGVWHKVNFIGD